MSRRDRTAIPLDARPEWLGAPIPTRTTVFFRTSILWQMVRFAVINLKMLVIIGASHRGERRPSA